MAYSEGRSSRGVLPSPPIFQLLLPIPVSRRLLLEWSRHRFQNQHRGLFEPLSGSLDLFYLLN